MEEVESVKVTTVVDNDVWKEGLRSSWGLSFLVESYSNNRRHSILMDTSGSFEILFSNASKLSLNLSAVDAIFISHWHRDHCGALSQVLHLLRRQIPVYLPSHNSFGLGEIKEAGCQPAICHEPVELINGIMSTGELVNGLSEHSLLVNVEGELVVLTGCSHPGLVNVLKHAQKVSNTEKIRAVIGGFHISGTNEGLRMGEFLRKLNVRLVSPCHCTSRDARRAIARIMRERYVRNGSGKSIALGRLLDN